eukprot:evm.model.scf_905.2 EVM.evm.TU.scf_905.2   scf_905:10452-23846(+)
MGRVKNREEKKKAARIFSSGCGGGTRGPSVVDKRGQEVNCPHCGKIFKQSGRLQDHIQRHHNDDKRQPDAEEQEERPSGSEEGCSSQAVLSVQDVGSKPGFYTHKSPKLMLLEWCQKQGRRRPIYKLKAQPDGRVSGRVVLPDEKYANKDIVVHLPKEFAADSEQEAAQYAATAALHHVAGDRALDRVLPPDYVAIWNDCAKRKEERDRLEQEWEGRRKQAETNKMRAARRQQKVVVMSEQNQRMVEAVVRNIKGQQSDTSTCDASTSSRPAPEASLRQIDRQLKAMGFSEDQRMAAQAALDVDAQLSEHLDWLLLNMSSENLPKQLAGSSATNIVGVLRTAYDDRTAECKNDPIVLGLCEYGYHYSEAAEALGQTNHDPEEALQRLFSKLTGIEVVSACEMQIADEDSAWREECTALEAIYGEDIEFPSPSSACLTVCVECDEVESLNSQGEALKVTLLINSIPNDYPEAIPVIAVSCTDVPHQGLKTVTLKLVEHAQELLGCPMVHDLATAVPELLKGVDFDEAKKCIEKVTETPHPQEDIEVEAIHEEDKQLMPAEPVRNSVHTAPRKGRRAPQLSPADLEAENRILELQQNELARSSQHDGIRKQRQGLPAFEQRNEVLEAVECSQVVVVTGMPGCGKSTQVPQFILENAISNGQGSRCSIVCTQPRRISALGLAHRVADERAEEVGEVVGYAIKNQSCRSKRTRIMYCTIGVLLRQMISNQHLSNVSHVVVDEVHERSVDVDLLLLLVKNNLKRPKCHKVVLMSATANAPDFVNYFSNEKCNVSVVHIPGFTHPVREFFLEDAVRMTGFTPSKGQFGTLSDRSQGNGDEGKQGSQARKATALQDELQACYELIECLVAYIVSEEKLRGPAALLQGWSEFTPEEQKRVSACGAILVFLPGALEINNVARALRESPKIQGVCGRQGLEVMALHATLPPGEQRRVFDAMPKGVRKVVVSTNVAETSVTIPDVAVVIDTCFVKEVGYDPERRISRLQLTHVSQAAAKQRAGRAGRVRCGVCFRLVTNRQWGKLRRHQEPEICRVPLESLCLNLAALLGHSLSVEECLRQCLTPPGSGHAEAALKTLEEVGAMGQDRLLTPLGQHLVRMPVDVRVGKMLVYAAILQCLDPVLTIAAAMSYGRSVFLSPLDRRAEADAARKELCTVSKVAHTKSDHLAIVAAFSQWVSTKEKGGNAAASQFCRRNYVSSDAMQATLAGRAEYATILADLGFVPPSYSPAAAPAPVGANKFVSNTRFVRAAVCAGFYPNILRVEHPPKRYAEVGAGAVAVEGEAKQVKFFDRDRQRVFLHPASVNFDTARFESGWLVYSEMVQTAKVYVRAASMVPVYAMLLFGGEVAVRADRGLIVLDGWAEFAAPAKVAVLLRELREELGRMLAAKIDDPGLDLGASEAVGAVMQLLHTDGF